MKIAICTTPIRPTCTDYPPIGAMQIIQSLQKAGHDVKFYNIDYLRPNKDEVENFFQINSFELIGISAVVSTAYSYTKWLAELIKRVSENTTIVVGGNLAASAEILLRKCNVDFCVVGDGEIIIQELANAVQECVKKTI